MAHTSPETIAHIEQKQQALARSADAKNTTILGSLQKDHQDRDELVRLLLQREDLVLPDDPADAAQYEVVARSVHDLATAIVREGARRNVRELLAELKRLRQPANEALLSIAERLGVEAESVIKSAG